MANDNYINKITDTDGNTWDIRDTVSGYTTNTGTVTGMTTTAGTHTAGAQTVTNGIITTNIPTKTSHLTNDSGFITTDSDTKVSTAAVTSGTQYYPIVGTNTTSAATKYYDVDYGYLASSGTTSALGYGRLKLGNTTASGTAGNKYGVIRLCGTGAKYIDFRAQTVTSNRTLDLPDISGNMLAVDSNKLLSSPVKAQASDGTAERVVNIKYGSAAPTGSATTGTVYFQTGSSAYTFVDRTDIGGKSCTTSGTDLASFTLLPGLYLITYQFNCGTISSGTVRCDMKLGSVLKNQVRGGSGYILSGSAIVQCIDSSSTISFKGYTTSGTSSSTELHYSYVKLF